VGLEHITIADFGLKSGGQGNRAVALMKQRQESAAKLEADKAQLEKESSQGAKDIDSKFSGKFVESFQAKTYGLMSLKDIRKNREEMEAAKEERLAELLKPKLEAPDAKKKKKKKKKKKATMSFDFADDDDEDVEPVPKKAKVSLKNPEVDTSFLPDREREYAEEVERDRLRSVWTAEQNKMKAEMVHITYSYWDGTGHRRDIKMKKGNSIDDFLKAALADLRKEFHELRGITSEGLIYIKEDLILPGHSTFHDFIVTKARGKSGPLFSFDVHDDVRLGGAQAGAAAETEESHAGKIILRVWYDRNKHIYPANRWEQFDPEKDYGSYKTGDFPDTTTSRNLHEPPGAG